MMRMVYGNATLHWSGPEGDWKQCIKSWTDHAAYHHNRHEVYRKPMMVAYQEIFENTDEEIISYTHDDVLIGEYNWDKRVLKEFEDPTVGMVGFGGARGHCVANLYDLPFNFSHMGRIGFMSNMRDAESHGSRFTGERDVSVFDGMALFVRRSVLEKCGGWPQGTPISYWAYDYWISCEVRRQGLRNRLVGVACDHLGGRSPSIIPEDIVAAHRELYDEYRDVLPAMVD
jgi:hypothetical protein